MAFLISTSSSNPRDKLKDSSLIFLKTLVELSSLKEFGNILEEKLVILSYSVTTRRFCFTANGFFELDNTMVFNLLGSTVYYVIICLELN